MTIEDALRHHAASGSALALTIFRTSSGSYQASMSVDRNAFRVEIDPEPDVALKRVLGLCPGAAGQMLPQPGGAFD